MWMNMAYAQAAAGAAGGAGGPSIVEQLLPFAFVFVILYFLMIRPQQKKFKTHQSFLGQLKRGDEVLTSGGVLGRIEGLTDKYITLEVADDVRIRILKSQIASPATEEQQK